MADTGTTTEVQETEAQTTTTTTDATKDPFAGLPEEFAWVKSDLESTRREAASRRVEVRKLEEQLKDAKTPEDVTKAVEEAAKRSTQLEAELARERAARKHKLDDEFLEFLTGATPEQIESQAAKLAALAPKVTAPKPNPRGGVNPADTNLPELSGRDAWKKFKGR